MVFPGNTSFIVLWAREESLKTSASELNLDTFCNKISSPVLNLIIDPNTFLESYFLLSQTKVTRPLNHPFISSFFTHLNLNLITV